MPQEEEQMQSGNEPSVRLQRLETDYIHKQHDALGLIFNPTYLGRWTPNHGVSMQ